MSMPSAHGTSVPPESPSGPKKRLWPLATLLAVTAAGVLYSVPGGTPPPAGPPLNPADTSWVLTATALVLLMTPGLAFFYGGMVGRKHIVSTMFLSFMAIGVVTLLWIAVGFSLAFGDSLGGIIGDPRTFFMFRDVTLLPNAALSPTVPLILFALFQMKFAIITPALITGAFVERIRFAAFIAVMILFSLFVYAPLAHMTWHPDGILRHWGVLDFAGGTVVHMSAGFAGLAGAMMVGRKKKRGIGVATVPSNIPFVLLGTGMLWFGWFGFNAGSALAANEQAVLAFMTTNTAAAAAMVAWLLVDVAFGRKATALGAAIGAVVGLVAVTPASGFVGVGASLVIGIVASIASNLTINLGLKSVVDDTLDVFACHGVGGLVGMLLTGVFAKDGGWLTSGDPTLFGKHLAAAAGVSVFAFVSSLAIYKLVGFGVALHLHEKDGDLAPGVSAEAFAEGAVTAS